MPNWKKLIVSGSDATLNSLDVTNNISASNLYVKDEIIHHGDTNTKIKFQDDKIIFKPGGANFIELSEGSTDLITLNRNVSASGHISSSGLYVESSTITDFIKLNSLGSSANPIKLIFEKSATEQGIIEYNRNGDLEIFNSDGDGGVMIDGTTSAGGDFYVANSGNVGIGNTSPPKELTVEGDISGSGTLLLEGGITASNNIQGASITIGTDTVYSNALNIHNSGAIRIGNAEYISKSGNDLSLFQGRVKVHNEGRGTTFDGSITASADISASGNLTVDQIIASGAISASGQIFGNSLKTDQYLYFGSDVSLFRDGVNILRTDDIFHANGDIHIFDRLVALPTCNLPVFT